MAARPAREELRYLPAAVEIEVTPPSPAARLLAGALLLCVTVAVAWALVGEVEIVATARGRVVPAGQVQPVQVSLGGRVSALRVVEGEAVSPGQPLLELDATLARADLATLQQRGELLKRERLRIDRLLHLARQAPPPDEPLAAPESALVAAEWQAQQAALRRLQQRRQAVQAERAEVLLQVEQGAQLQPILQRQADDLQRLWQQQALPEYQYLDAEQRAIEQRYALNALQQRVARLEADLAAADAALLQQRAGFEQELLAQLEQVTQQLAANRAAVEKARHRVGEHRLVAPVAGVVQQLAVNTPGAVVSAAQRLLEIVPTGQRLELEALVENRDIGFVQPGQAVTVKLDSYPFTRHGSLSGRVATLSASDLDEPRGGHRYLARITLDAERLADGPVALSVRPGMTATVDIRTGQRRLIDYLLGPLRRVGSESLRER